MRSCHDVEKLGACYRPSSKLVILIEREKSYTTTYLVWSQTNINPNLKNFKKAQFAFPNKSPAQYSKQCRPISTLAILAPINSTYEHTTFTLYIQSALSSSFTIRTKTAAHKLRARLGFLFHRKKWVPMVVQARATMIEGNQRHQNWCLSLQRRVSNSLSVGLPAALKMASMLNVLVLVHRFI